MLVSIFPAADADVGLDADTKNVTILARASPWIDPAEFTPPPQPDMPPSAKADPRATGASMMTAGLIGSLAVLASLY
jgi:hypothetical protein